MLGAAAPEIRGVELGGGPRVRLRRLPPAGEEVEPGPRLRRPRLLAAKREHRLGPFLEALLEERQVQEPLARIVDDLEPQGRKRRHRAPEQRARPVADGDAERARAGGRFRPARRIGREALQKLLVGEGAPLDRLDPGAEEPAAEPGAEDRQHDRIGRRGKEIVRERRDEDRLAGLREAGDGEADGPLGKELA